MYDEFIMQPLVLCSDDASEDMKACRQVLSGNGADWKKTSFRVRSWWRPELSVAFWLSFYLGRELSTGPRGQAGISMPETSLPQSQHFVSPFSCFMTRPRLPPARRSSVF